MKLFFMADIHGSLFYLKKAIERFKAENADYMVILGDELYHGARNPLPPEYNPREVTALLNGFAAKIIAVRGNCDSEVDDMVLEYPVLAPFSIILCGGRRLFLTHGHLFDENSLPKLCPGDVFFYGHTHVSKAEKQGEIFVVNPGSVSMPKEDTPHSYAVMENDTIVLKDLDGKTYRELHLA